MYCFLIVLAAFLFSSQFMFTEGCQRENGSGWNITLKLSFYGSIIGIPILMLMNIITRGFPEGLILQFSWFSFCVSLVSSISALAFSYFTIKAFEYTSLSVYTVFSMIGGMTLPFIYGVIFRGDKINVVKIVCFVLIILSVILMNEKDKISKKSFVYCLAVFFLNGMSGIFSSFHQSHTMYCVDSGSYMIIGKGITIILCLILITKTKDFKVNLKTIAYSTGAVGFNSVANLFLLIALTDNHVYTSVQYPLVTGGTIVFSILIDLLRGTKVTKKQFIAAGIALVSSCLIGL